MNLISVANILDIDELYELTKKCALHLIESNIYQWNEQYPSKEILSNDLERKQLYKLTLESKIIGIIVITEIEDHEYASVKWLTPNYKNIYIHRLAILPNFQGQGYAQKLMDFAEHYAKTKGYNSVRLDTFSLNQRNLNFYKKRGYQRLESIYFPKQSEFPFYCFELVLK